MLADFDFGCIVRAKTRAHAIMVLWLFRDRFSPSVSGTTAVQCWTQGCNRTVAITEFRSMWSDDEGDGGT